MKWLFSHTDDFIREEYVQTYAQLTPSRKARVDRLKKVNDRIRSLLAERMVHKLLREEFGIRDGLLEADEKGKPYISNYPLYVSIAHCRNLVVCAVDKEPVGIDTEQIMSRNISLAKRFFREEELAYIMAGESPDKPLGFCRERDKLIRFYEVWTAKEAWFKLLGTGITNMKDVNILELDRQCHFVEDYIVQIVRKSH